MNTVQSFVYLDTSALARRAEMTVPNPSARNVHAGQPVEELLLNDSTKVVGLSELTLIEFHDVLATDWRSNKPDHGEYDQAWAELAQLSLAQLVADGRLVLRRVPPRAAEHAIALVTLATREHGNGLRTWDAIHLITAGAWAHEIEAQVELWTTDTDFQRFVELFPHFQRFVQVRNLDL